MTAANLSIWSEPKMLAIRQFEEETKKWMDAVCEDKTNGVNDAVDNDDEVGHEDVYDDMGPEDNASQVAANIKSPRKRRPNVGR